MLYGSIAELYMAADPSHASELRVRGVPESIMPDLRVEGPDNSRHERELFR
jgi:hypothetical protein